MGSGGLFVLLSLMTNTQQHTEKSDVIVQEMGANRVKISSIFTAYMYLDTVFLYLLFKSNTKNVSPKLDIRQWKN